MVAKQRRDGAYERIRREMSSLEQASMPTKEVEPKPKRRLLDFDQSDDEESDNDDALDAELRRF